MRPKARVLTATSVDRQSEAAPDTGCDDSRMDRLSLVAPAPLLRTSWPSP
jgi:hypothetical protein